MAWVLVAVLIYCATVGVIALALFRAAASGDAQLDRELRRRS